MAEKNIFLYVPNGMVRFVNQHSTDLIRGVSVVDPILNDLLHQNILTQEQYCATRSNSTSQTKMRELYKYVRAWSDQNKIILYRSLKKHNKLLIKYLDHQDKQPLPRREHFLDRHQKELIEKIPVEKPILYCLAEEGLLTYKERGAIEAKETPSEKISMLYSYIGSWSNRQKDALYDILEEWNGPIIRLLKEKDEKQTKPPVIHFVDRHRWDLIDWVYEFQPVLDSLLNQHLLTKEQYDSICSKKTPQDKMTGLYCVVGGWDDGDKDKLYDSLRKHNRLLIGDLEYKDRDLLPPSTPPPSIKKIRFSVPQQAAVSFKKIRISASKQAEMHRFEDKSPIFINMVLPVQTSPPSFHIQLPVQEHHHHPQKKEDFQIQEETRHKDLPVLDCEGGDHFVDKHREALISRVPLVYPILESLMAENVLNNEQYDNIRSKPSTREKMRELYKYITAIGDAAKDKFYNALKKYNAFLIQNLKGT